MAASSSAAVTLTKVEIDWKAEKEDIVNSYISVAKEALKYYADENHLNPLSIKLEIASGLCKKDADIYAEICTELAPALFDKTRICGLFNTALKVSVLQKGESGEWDVVAYVIVSRAPLTDAQKKQLIPPGTRPIIVNAVKEE